MPPRFRVYHWVFSDHGFVPAAFFALTTELLPFLSRASILNIAVPPGSRGPQIASWRGAGQQHPFGRLLIEVRDRSPQSFIERDGRLPTQHSSRSRDVGAALRRGRPAAAVHIQCESANR